MRWSSSLESGAPLVASRRCNRCRIARAPMHRSCETARARLCRAARRHRLARYVQRSDGAALRERGAQVESMEGFAVLRAAERAGVPASRFAASQIAAATASERLELRGRHRADCDACSMRCSTHAYGNARRREGIHSRLLAVSQRYVYFRRADERIARRCAAGPRAPRRHRGAQRRRRARRVSSSQRSVTARFRF